MNSCKQQTLKTMGLKTAFVSPMSNIIKKSKVKYANFNVALSVNKNLGKIK